MHAAVALSHQAAWPPKEVQMLVMLGTAFESTAGLPRNAAMQLLVVAHIWQNQNKLFAMPNMRFSTSFTLSLSRAFL